MAARFKRYMARIAPNAPSAGAVVMVCGEVGTRAHPNHLYVVALTPATDDTGRPIRVGAECVVERTHVQPIPEPAKA